MCAQADGSASSVRASIKAFVRWYETNREHTLNRGVLKSARDSGAFGKISYGLSFAFYRCISAKVWREVEIAIDRLSC
jgi:hypothetical protein